MRLGSEVLKHCGDADGLGFFDRICSCRPDGRGFLVSSGAVRADLTVAGFFGLLEKFQDQTSEMLQNAFLEISWRDFCAWKSIGVIMRAIPKTHDPDSQKQQKP